MHADDVGRKHIDGLAQHRGLRFYASDSPSDHAQTIDHRGVRVGAYQCVRVINAVSFKHDLAQILQIDLMTYADARRYDAEALERLHAPFQELIAGAVALELHDHVLLKSIGQVEEIDL